MFKKKDKITVLQEQQLEIENKLKKEEIRQKEELRKLYKEMEATRLKEKENEEKRSKKEVKIIPPKDQGLYHTHLKDTSHKEKSFIQGIKAKLLDRFKPASTILIEIVHYNGTISHYVIASKAHKFVLKGNAYIIDEEKKVYCSSSKLWMYRFHEGFSLPFSVDVSAHEMKKGADDLNNKEIDEVATSFNPSVLVDVLKFEYAKGVIQGAEVHDFLKRSFLISIITLATVLIHFLVHAYKAGWIKI